MNYRNVFDKDSKAHAEKNEDGTFQSPSPLKWGDAFTEGNNWHYSWSVFHDPQGLIDLMGGKDMFITMLDSVFFPYLLSLMRVITGRLFMRFVK